MSTENGIRDSRVAGKEGRAFRPLSECAICCQLRPLRAHLFELAEFCSYLGDTAPSKDEDADRKVETRVIGEWLRLASRLEKVEINTWEYAGDDGFYCGTVADRIDSDDKLFTAYSTSLTLFLFVCNGLEETYRFVAHHYEAKKASLDKKLHVRSPSLKAAYLLNELSLSELPAHFLHIAGNLDVFFSAYSKEHLPKLSGLERVSKSDLNYPIHLVRNLRNQVVHGAFPLVDNVDSASSPELKKIENLLQHGCRVAAVCIQALLGKYCHGFHSLDYEAIANANGEKYAQFIEGCTLDYLMKLHLEGNFSLSNW